jgi:iron complex outermembrane recepter protein
MNRWIAGSLLAAFLCPIAWAVDDTTRQDDDETTDEPVVIGWLPALLIQDRVVVTTPPMTDPYTIVTSPRQPRLPLPAHDGGSYLKSIPGFSLSRKGGTSGDPQLRGLGGSRLNILVDDATLLGGCGGRMDPPTAYVFPEAYDQIEVLKGPQSVRYGASAAGVVRFERDPMQLDQPGLNAYASATIGRFDRRDLTGELTLAGSRGHARFIGTRSSQDDYADGNGETIHSQYERWSTTAVVGWRPDDSTLIELSHERSDAQAAYDDRMMDGTRFDRTGYSLRAIRQAIFPWLPEVEALFFYNHVDHVMDNFTLRQPPMRPAVSFPDRRTRGVRLTVEVRPGKDLELSVGMDLADNRHRSNVLRGADVALFGSVPRLANAEFSESGLFVEMQRPQGEHGRWTAGARIDRSRAEALDVDGFGGVSPGTSRRTRQYSGFVRYGHAFDRLGLALHGGLGRAERSPDFWESRRDFALSNEVLTQLDTGLSYQGASLNWSLALFYGWLDDYILINSPAVASVEARNVDATTYGGELDLVFRLSEYWRMNASAAWLRSHNDSDQVALAQASPANASLGLDYDDQRWFAGLLWRLVAHQNRIHPGHGTIYSLDTEPTPGFGVLSMYAGRHLAPRWTLTGGIDNLLDRQYAEHIQRGSADLGTSTERIPEPGRSIWLRLNGNFGH